jgi:hypothetical protein
MTDASEFISGGYYLVTKFKRPNDIASALPDTLISLSKCFTEIGPGDWLLRSWNWTLEQSAEEAGLFGIPQDLVVSMLDWCKPDLFEEWPNSFRTVDSALEFVRRLVQSADVIVVGIGLHPDLVESFLSQINKDPNDGSGLIEQVKRGAPLSPVGQPLGFEPLGFEGMAFHSWLCHGATPEAEAKLGVRTNQNGLISDFHDAVRVTEHLVATGAEPAIWEPWLLMRYTP